jgi:hypothetical protein
VFHDNTTQKELLYCAVKKKSIRVSPLRDLFFADSEIISLRSFCNHKVLTLSIV